MSDDSLLQFVSRVAAHVHATSASFERFARPGVITHPVPFFGDVTSARVLTVGVNPSAGEFVGRTWPQTMPDVALTERLVRYFSDGRRPPHPWFETWSDALAVIDASYRCDAAHLDLSPRATAAMGTQADSAGFAQMVENDARWFFELLPFCRNARALLVAGCVTKRWYINDFIARIAPMYGYGLTGRAESTGEGRIGVHRLVGASRSLPVFFCSVSPSGRKRHLLAERAREHREVIVDWLSDSSAAVMP